MSPCWESQSVPVYQMQQMLLRTVHPEFFLNSWHHARLQEYYYSCCLFNQHLGLPVGKRCCYTLKAHRAFLLCHLPMPNGIIIDQTPFFVTHQYLFPRITENPTVIRMLVKHHRNRMLRAIQHICPSNI